MQSAFAWRARAILRWLFVGKKRSARFPRVHGVPRGLLAVISPCPIKGHCTGVPPPPFGARPCSDMPAAHYSAQSAFALARLCADCLWGGGAARALVARAHRAVLVAIGSCPMEEHCTGKKPLSFGARPCCGVPATTSNARPARGRLLLGARRHTTALVLFEKKMSVPNATRWNGEFDCIAGWNSMPNGTPTAFERCYKNAKIDSPGLRGGRAPHHRVRVRGAVLRGQARG